MSTQQKHIDWYPDPLVVAASAFERQPWACSAGLLIGWTALYVALWIAALFALIGAIIGFVAGSSLYVNLGQGAQAFTFAGALAGAATGFVAGFTAFFGASITVAPIHVGISLGIGLVAAGVLTWIFTTQEPLLLDFRSYRNPSHRVDEARVAATLKEVAMRLGYSAPPKLRVADQPVPAAWAYSTTIVVTKGLINQMDNEEVAAVLAHEMHHCVSGDSLAQRFVWACCFPIVIVHNLYAVAMKSLWFKALVVIFLWPAPVLIRFLVAPLMAARGRRQEFEADAAAIAAGYGPALARALEKLQNFEVARSGWEAALVKTHPPTEYRLEAIEDAAATAPRKTRAKLAVPTGNGSMVIEA